MCVARQTMILSRMESSVFLVFTAAGMQIVESKPLTNGTEQVIVVRCPANILLLVPFHV